jgi:alkaline phosphatase
MEIWIYFLLYLVATVNAYVDWTADMNVEKWNKQAKDTIDSMLRNRQNRNIAKNIILFLGDGMGITTVTAGRIYKGFVKNKNLLSIYSTR